MKELSIFIKNIIYNWLHCVFNPYNSCRDIVIEKQITDIEKIQYAFGNWLVAFLFTIILEIPVFSFFHIEWASPQFIIPFFGIGFLYLIVASAFFHLGLLVFKIPSKLTDTFFIYSSLIGSFSPFILLGIYPLVLKNINLLKIFKANNYDFNYLFNNIKIINDNFDKNIIITIIGPIGSIISNILTCSLGVLLCLIIIEKYNSEKLRTFICVTFSQTIFLILPLLFVKIIECFVIIQNLKIN